MVIQMYCSHNLLTQVSISTVVLLLLVFNQSVDAQTLGGDTAELIEALQKRANTVHSMDVHWEAITKYTAHYGETLSMTPFDHKSGKPPAKEMFKATEISWNGRLVVEGVKIRYEDSCPLWNYPVG